MQRFMEARSLAGTLVNLSMLDMATYAIVENDDAPQDPTASVGVADKRDVL